MFADLDIVSDTPLRLPNRHRKLHATLDGQLLHQPEEPSQRARRFDPHDDRPPNRGIEVADGLAFVLQRLLDHRARVAIQHRNRLHTPSRSHPHGGGRGVLVGHRVLICDRDAKWSAPVRARLDEARIRVVQTPFQAPNANAYAERFVRSIKHECLNRVIPFGERHLRQTIAEYVEHYHRERNHQGLDNELIDGAPPIEGVKRIRRQQRLGRFLNYYCRPA
jgi:hypothetical protein